MMTSTPGVFPHMVKADAPNPALMDGAACRNPGNDPTWWYALPIEGSGARSPEDTKRGARDHQRAIEVCTTCPLLLACARWGMEVEDYGVWGGLAPWERDELGGRGRPRPRVARAGRESILRTIYRRFHHDTATAIIAMGSQELQDGAA